MWIPLIARVFQNIQLQFQQLQQVMLVSRHKYLSKLKVEETTFGVPWPSSLARAIITRRLFLLHCLYGFGDGVQPCLTKVHI